MNRLIKTLGNGITIISMLYAIVLLLLFIAPFFVNRPEMKGLIRSVLAILLFPSLFLLPLLALFKVSNLSLLMILPVLGFALVYGPFLLPRSTIAIEDTQLIKVLTFNIQTASQNPESVTTIIRKANADIVGVQELSLQAADHFRRALADEYPYQVLYPQENPYIGQGILSRYPVLTEEYWPNEELEATLGHLRVELDVNAERINVYNTHPVPPFSFIGQSSLQAHSGEIAILLERANGESGPVILLGDFNMTDQFDEYQQITRTYADTIREVGSPGFGFTFPGGSRFSLTPLIRLDYIFYNSYFRGKQAYVLTQSGTSDHLPVWGELALLSDK